MTVEERLNELLNEKDKEIEKLRDELDHLKSYVKNKHFGWMEHRELPADFHPELPVPRLQFTYFKRDWELVCRYELVYRHHLGHCVAIPLGQTSTSGGERSKGPFEDVGNGEKELFVPFRDGVHMNTDMKRFGIPGFAIHEDYVTSIEDLNARVEKRRKASGW